MRSLDLITKIVPLFLWSAKMPKIYAKCQKFMQKLWNFIFCHLNIVRAVYKLSFKLLVRSVAQITKIVPPFLWFRGGLCYKHRKIRHGVFCTYILKLRYIFRPSKFEQKYLIKRKPGQGNIETYICTEPIIEIR